MVCRVCGKQSAPGDRFCTGCGTPLDPAAPSAGEAAGSPTGGAPATDQLATTELLTAVDGADTDATGELDVDPVWAATGATPVQPVATSELPATEPVVEVPEVRTAPAPVEVPGPYDFTAHETAPGPVVTAPLPVTPPLPPPGHRFRFAAVTAIGIVAGLVTLVSLFVDVLTIESDTRLTPSDRMPAGFRTGTWILDDLADNLSIAGLVATLLMVAGGVAASFGWRWGSGLAGGGGLAFAGIAAIAVGLVQVPIDAAHEFARIPSEDVFTLTITRDVGYWLLIVAGALGVVVFFASVNDAGSDRRPGLNPWIAALGALATLVMAAGPLIPERLAEVSDNWYVGDGPGAMPALLLVGRLAQLALLALTGIIGFLGVRRWGIGLAIGGALPSIWLAVSTLFDLTDRPVGPGVGNPGAVDVHLHGVTIIGTSAVVAMAVLAVIAAYDQGVREAG